MSLATECIPSTQSLPTPEESEMALVHAAKTGDISAFEELLRRNQAMVFRVAQHITGSREDAEEVTQEALLKAFHNLQRFEERSRFSTWVRITVNTALMRLRHRRRHEIVPIRNEDGQGADAAPQEVVDWRPNPEQLYGRHELREILARALAELPQHYSTVVLLRDVEGLSTAETAEALDLSVATVKTRLLRARLQLREHLSRHFGLPQRESRSRRH